MAVSITGLVSGVSNVGSALHSFASGGTNGSLILGDFTFKLFEVPERIEYGGTQQLVVHKLDGGRRIIDLMGLDPHDITWEGQFLGADAHARVVKLNKIRIDGKPVALSFGEVKAQVIVKDVTLTYQRSSLIRYKIVCVVAPVANTGMDKLAKGGWLGQLRDAVGQVANFIDDAKQQVEDALAPVVMTLQQVNAVIGPITNALGIHNLLLTALDTGLSSARDYGSIAGIAQSAQSYQYLSKSFASVQTTCQATSGASAAALAAIQANVATSGGIARLPANAPATISAINGAVAVDGAPIVWSTADLVSAASATTTQAMVVPTNAMVTLAERELILGGQITAGAFPNLQAVTSDLYSPATIVSTIDQAVGITTAVAAAYAAQKLQQANA